MRAFLAATLSAALISAPFALAAPTAALARGAGGGHGGAAHGGAFHIGPRGGSRGFNQRTGFRGRGRFGGHPGNYGLGSYGELGETSLGLGLAASLAYGYADYYGDYEALPVVAPDYGYPSAFEDGKWPSETPPDHVGGY